MAFTAYCDELREKSGVFDIAAYIKTRKESTEINSVYFSKVFQNFLEEKYLEKPEEQ